MVSSEPACSGMDGPTQLNREEGSWRKWNMPESRLPWIRWLANVRWATGPAGNLSSSEPRLPVIPAWVSCRSRCRGISCPRSVGFQQRLHPSRVVLQKWVEQGGHWIAVVFIRIGPLEAIKGPYVLRTIFRPVEPSLSFWIENRSITIIFGNENYKNKIITMIYAYFNSSLMFGYKK